MAIAAVPAYLGRDFGSASPGLRFGMYLPLWGEDGATREHLWTTHDLNERSAGPHREMRVFKDENKTDALRQALKLNPSDAAAMRALLARQGFLALPLAAAGRLRIVEAQAVAPFTTGLGNEHPLENGFAFLNPYGLPYLPGSGVKGVLRQAARELASGDWGETQGWDTAAIEALFGRTCDDEDGLQRGALTCWDVIPQLEGETLQVEIMTPHQSHYLQGSETPHDSGSPNPISFLTVPPRSRFVFHLQCDLPFLARIAPELAREGRWAAMLDAALAHAFAWLGFGAKTAVGYGAMEVDRAARLRREQQQQVLEQTRAEALRREAQATMSPEDRAWDEARPVIERFQAAFDKARTAAFNPGGPFAAERAAFMREAAGWSEPRSRQAAGELLERTATKAWGRPSNKERWQELQALIAALKGAGA